MPTPLDPELVAQIRESLHAGRGVRLFGDEPPVAKLDVLTPMTAEGEAFLDGKLEKIAELLERGFVVNIDNDGAILAGTPDNRSRYISTMETEIDAMDRLMVKTALEQGATVAIEADGSLVINAAAAPTTVPAATAAAQFAEFERMADSGQIGTELAAGRDFNFDAAAVAAPVTAAPVAAAAIEDPFDTAAELVVEAEGLQMGLDAARELALPEYINDRQEAEVQRMAAERQLAMTNAERDVAQRQAAAAQATVVSSTLEAASYRVQAAQMREQGKASQAAAVEGDAENLDAIATANVQIAQAAQLEFEKADSRVAAETAELDRLTVASQEVNAEAYAFEEVLNEQQAQVANAREAAKELAEAERLEAALPDMEARGVEGLDRIRTAIAEHRAKAENFVEQGKLRETTGIVVTEHDKTDPEVAEPTVDPEVPAPILTDPDDSVTDDPAPDEGSPVPTEPTVSESDDPSSPASSSHEPDIIDFGEESSAPSEPSGVTEPSEPYPDPIYPTMADPSQNDPDIIDMDDDRPWTPLEGSADDTVVLDIPEPDSFNDAPQFEQRLDDINELSQDLDELTD